MLFSRKSMFSGITHTLEIDVTPEQYNNWQNGMCIQEAMPNVSAEHREFLMTGITPEEWNESMGNDMGNDGAVDQYTSLFNDNEITRTTYDLNEDFILSVICGKGTYSVQNRDGTWAEVEIAIMDKNGELRYELTGGDVTPYFPANRVSEFVDWFRKNYESEGFYSNLDGSDRNLPFAFLNNPNRGAITMTHLSTLE